MIRQKLVSRIERLEIRLAPEREWEPHTLVFVGMDRRPVSALRWNKEKRVWDTLDLTDETTRREFEESRARGEL